MGLVFKTVRAHDAHFGGAGDRQIPQRSFRVVGIRFRNACEFWSGLGEGSGRENGGSMMHGSGILA